MAVPVIMPRQGQSVESCIIVKWYKARGDKVKAGDLLFSYETDKASFEEEAGVNGTLLDIFFDEGEDVPCLTNVCVIGNPGESTAEFNPDTAKESSGKSKTEAVQEDASILTSEMRQIIAPSAPKEEASIKISPRARNLAEKQGVDYRYATPSGPYGRIIEKDITALKESGHVFTAPAREENMKGPASSTFSGTGIGGRITTVDLDAAVNITAAASVTPPAVPDAQLTVPNAPPVEEVKVTNIRKVIAKTMLHSLTSSAQLTLNSSFDATDILEFRKKLKECKDRLGLENITINDIIVYAVSRTLVKHKELNAHLLDDRMLYFKNANVGVAVDTERGLMVPTVYDANLKSLNDISKEVKKLVKDCQAGTVNPDLLKNGSFTVTNLGTLDIESFTPVLNPPQTGILGINTIVQRAREVEGDYVFYPAMALSLTFDHRALDGAPAAKFLKDLKDNLENFSALLAR